MGPARSLMGSPQAQTEGGQGPSSKIGSPKWPEDTAEDSLVLGRPKVSLMKVVYEQTLKIKKYLREIVLNTLH